MTTPRFYHCVNPKCRRRLAELVTGPRLTDYCPGCAHVSTLATDLGYRDGLAAGTASGVRLGYLRAAAVVGAGALLIAAVWAFVHF
jgi:hypothetical protein